MIKIKLAVKKKKKKKKKLCTGQSLFSLTAAIPCTSRELVDPSDVSRRCYFCRKEDCSLFDIGSIVYRVTASFTDAEKFRFVESVWKPDLLLKIPASKETSGKQ